MSPFPKTSRPGGVNRRGALSALAAAVAVSGTSAGAAPSFTVADRLAQHGARVAQRLKPDFARAGVPFPAAELAFLVFKDRRELQVHARSQAGGPWRFVRSYPVLAASGRPGPKLAEGDRQVPEGLYRAEALNPNSRFHLSIRLNYPNAFDRRMAAADRRTRLGGDIMIHGDAVSIGCLAMGDRAAEDLFVLAALVSTENVMVVIAPTDLRKRNAALPARSPVWLPALYGDIKRALSGFPQPPPR